MARDGHLSEQMPDFRASEDEIIADLYRQFAPYEHADQLHLCNCKVCCSEKDMTALISLPVRDVSCLLLSEFTNAVFRGTDNDEKRFLPRYFELILAGEIPCYLGLYAALGRLQNYDWLRAWRPNEARSVQAGFEAVAIAAVSEGHPLISRGNEDITGAICFGLNAGADIGRMLAAAYSVETTFATRQIADIIIAFWRDPFGHKAYEQGGGVWLSHPALKSRLENAFWVSNDPGDQQALSDAIKLI